MRSLFSVERKKIVLRLATREVTPLAKWISYVVSQFAHKSLIRYKKLGYGPRITLFPRENCRKLRYLKVLSVKTLLLKDVGILFLCLSTQYLSSRCRQYSSCSGCYQTAEKDVSRYLLERYYLWFYDWSWSTPENMFLIGELSIWLKSFRRFTLGFNIDEIFVCGQ